MSQATPTRAPWDTLARAAAARESKEEVEHRREFLAFLLGEDRYAIPIERVREIVRMRAITPVPRVPAEVRGVISLRGEIVQVVDLRLRLGLGPTEVARRTRVIVLHGDDGEATGLLVDAVREVLRIPDEDVQPPPTGESQFVEGLCARGEEFASLLNLERLLDLE